MTLQITSFHNDKNAYKRADAYRMLVAPGDRMAQLTAYLDNMVVQLRHHGGPSGFNFSAWRGTSNHDGNHTEAYALAIDYQIEQFEELRDATDQLGYARVWATGEDKARTFNTITLIIPFSAPATKAQYERIASCIVKELDVYGLVDGALAVNHIVNIHATTLTAFERGDLLDPARFIERTKDMYQKRDAKKYHAPSRPTRLEQDTPPVTLQADDAALFAFPA